jgi:hypothetical protein
MTEPLRHIRIGTPCSHRLVEGRGEIGVFEKIYPDGRTVYVAAREPSSKAPNAPPASVLREFADKTEALAALHRWGLRPQLPRRRKRDRVGVGQGEFQLGPFQTKEAYRLEMLRRKLGLIGG